MDVVDALTLARFDNVALKWAHAESLLSRAPYPFSDLDVTLRRTMDAFGPHRVLWASDYTATRERANWAESLFCIRRCPSLSEDDKEWILGRTARRLLNWAPPDSPRAPAPHERGRGRAGEDAACQADNHQTRRKDTQTE